MASSEPAAPNHSPTFVVRSIADLAEVDEDYLRQLATRVHLIDLAYAFGFGDVALCERLLSAVRPGLADQVRSAIVMAKASDQRYPVADSIRASQARVVDIARRVLNNEG